MIDKDSAREAVRGRERTPPAPVPAVEDSGPNPPQPGVSQAGGGSPLVGVEAPQPGIPSMDIEYLESQGIKGVANGADIGIPSETPFWMEPGYPCPTCNRRIPHPKKKTSPTSTVFSHRGPLDSKDDYKEIIEASAKHGGMTTTEKFWKHEYDLRMAAQNLAGPPGQLVKKP